MAESSADVPDEAASSSDGGKRPKAAPGRPRDGRIDEIVLRETLHELGINGLRNMSITGIAKRAGVAKATIYLRWPDRERLISDALASTGTGLTAPDSGDLRTDLRNIIRQWADVYRDPDLVRVFNRLDAEEKDYPAVVQQYRQATREPANKLVEQTIESAKRRGVVRQGVSARTAARAIVGALLLQNRLEGTVTEYFERQLLDFVLRGLQSD